MYPVVISFQNVAEYQQLKLTSEQVDKYWEQGYLSNIPVLSEEQCETLLKDYMNVFHSVGAPQTLLSICPPHNVAVKSCSHFLLPCLTVLFFFGLFLSELLANVVYIYKCIIKHQSYLERTL